ncbi:hypothetical protein EJ04DRAFT_527083 [Polyplosphaeria fusca]|uniref:Uncharacterized protein n=1 Tax=Polyplosphaeria fusca TaxID=682080 RepID=A0A9P4UXE9_9PLEO|nr:hypothetical protein EJ04DRAFT_527083 [Polyplosphaeria fusca]
MPSTSAPKVHGTMYDMYGDIKCMKKLASEFGVPIRSKEHEMYPALESIRRRRLAAWLEGSSGRDANRHMAVGDATLLDLRSECIARSLDWRGREEDLRRRLEKDKEMQSDHMRRGSDNEAFHVLWNRRIVAAYMITHNA